MKILNFSSELFQLDTSFLLTSHVKLTDFTGLFGHQNTHISRISQEYLLHIKEGILSIKQISNLDYTHSIRPPSRPTKKNARRKGQNREISLHFHLVKPSIPQITGFKPRNPLHTHPTEMPTGQNETALQSFRLEF